MLKHGRINPKGLAWLHNSDFSPFRGLNKRRSVDLIWKSERSLSLSLSSHSLTVITIGRLRRSFFRRHTDLRRRKGLLLSFSPFLCSSTLLSPALSFSFPSLSPLFYPFPDPLFGPSRWLLALPGRSPLHSALSLSLLSLSHLSAPHFPPIKPKLPATTVRRSPSLAFPLVVPLFSFLFSPPAPFYLSDQSLSAET